MKMKSIITVLVASACLMILASLSFAAGAEKMGGAAGAEKMGAIGTVTKIEGNKVTVQDEMGKEMTVDVKDVKDTKVGDKVKIEDGVIKSQTPTGEPGTAEKPKNPNY